MKKITAAFISLVGLTTLFACKNRSTYATAASGKSLLWEITGRGLQKPSYFYGTMHLMCAEDAELNETLKRLVKDVNQVYLEVDIDNAGELLSGMLELTDSHGNTLENTLSAGDYEKVRSFFTRVQPGVPFSILEKQPPLMISSSLYELMLPCEQKNGVEIKLVDEAYKAKKETKGLETLAFQAAIFDSIPYTEQANDLVKTLDSLDKYRRSMNDMLAVYKEQDIEKLYTMSIDEESATNGYMDILLFNRNKNWVGLFPSIAKSSSTLFAVGAGHLGGEKGVLNLLRKQGYSVRPIAN